MTVIIVERVPLRLRGELSRWLIEVATGVFVGKISALVRERLWLQCARDAASEDGSALLVWRVNSDQGFAVTSVNPKSRVVEEIDGVWLSRVLRSASNTDVLESASTLA